MNSEYRRLLEQEEKAHEELKRYSREAGEARNEFRRLRDELLSRIEALAHDADEMAAKFKRLYQESQDEFAFGNHEFAKELAEQGHKAEDECRRMNNDVKLLRRELDARSIEFKALDEAKKRAEREHENSMLRLRVKPRETEVAGFESSVLGDDWTAEKFLDGFPQGIFKKIEYVEYRDEPPDTEGMFGYADKNLTGTMMFVRMFRCESEAEFKRTMAEAIGSVVYREFLSDIERKKWPAEEDFRISFGLFMTNPRRLESSNEKSYALIKDIYTSLPDEEA